MPREVAVFPQTEEAISWLRVNFTRLGAAFRQCHKTSAPELSSHHPHGMTLETPVLRDPDEPPVHAHVGAHWSLLHEEQTKKDILFVLEKLGANVSHFLVEGTEDAEA